MSVFGGIMGRFLDFEIYTRHAEHTLLQKGLGNFINKISKRSGKTTVANAPFILR